MPLGEPPSDLSGFPAWTQRPRQALARIHRTGKDARFLGSSGDSRFDLAAPRGTLYAAETPVGAFLEAFRAVPFVAQAEVDARMLAIVRAPDARRLADCTNPRSRRFGITAAIHSTPDYTLCQRWAEAFANARFDGIRYFVSHDPSTSEVAQAIFGQAGIDDSVLVDDDGPIAPQVIEDVRRRFGILVLPTPS